MRILYRIVGFGALLVLLPLVGACVGALQPTACSAGAAAGDWIGEDFWVRADLARVQRELACGGSRKNACAVFRACARVENAHKEKRPARSFSLLAGQSTRG